MNEIELDWTHMYTHVSRLISSDSSYNKPGDTGDISSKCRKEVRFRLLSLRYFLVVCIIFPPIFIYLISKKKRPFRLYTVKCCLIVLTSVIIV